jgi:hypothetical protein
MRAASTTPRSVALPEVSSTAKANAAGAIELPSNDMSCPAENQRNAGVPSGDGEEVVEGTAQEYRIPCRPRYYFGGRRKMVLLRLSSLALSRSRFALSPLAETLGSTIVLGKPRPSDPWLASWHTRHRPALASVVAAVPPPGNMSTTLAEELQAVTAASDEFVREELA